MQKERPNWGPRVAQEVVWSPASHWPVRMAFQRLQRRSLGVVLRAEMDCDGKDFQRRKNKNNTNRNGIGPVAGR